MGRESVYSLDGEWKYIIDPYESGYYGHQGDIRPSGYFQNRQPGDKYELLEYNFETSRTINVPGDWNTQSDQLFHYEGSVWYQRYFNVDKKDNKRYFVHFGAVNYQCIVFINGQRVGQHEGGFTPFSFEVTDQVKDYKNDIILLVDNKRHRDAIPAALTDWFNYGGITRSVNLVETLPTSVTNYHIQLDKNNSQNITGWINIQGPNKTIEGELLIPELNIKKKLAFQNGTVSLDLRANPILWSSANPKLYEVLITLANGEIVKDNIGFRTVSVKGTEIHVNGKKVFLNGISIHEEFPGAGRAHSRKHAEHMLGAAKELGCNFVRLAHYPHNEHMLHVADSLGLMIWSEIPVYWGIDWGKTYVLDKAKLALEEMVLRDQNRASIILWSMANETQPIPDRNIFLSELIKKAREMDPNRLITAATETHVDETNPAVFWLQDPINEQLDVMANNIYCGWYFDNPEGGCSAMTIKSRFNKPLIMSEFGAGAKAGFHGSERDRWTEEFQERVIEEDFKMLNKIEFLAGTVPWLLFDFRSPRRVLPEIQDGYNRKGLISEKSERKKAFETVKRYYQNK
ncbi:MAG: glycoside hydrolase family 2 TIM barrel-domain containing protein [Bacteroidota bacterium]